jgi:hypothetical protein
MDQEAIAEALAAVEALAEGDPATLAERVAAALELVSGQFTAMLQELATFEDAAAADAAPVDA